MSVRHSRAPSDTDSEPKGSSLSRILSHVTAAQAWEYRTPLTEVVRRPGDTSETYIILIAPVDEPVVSDLRDALEEAMRLASDPIGAAVLTRTLRAIARLEAVLTPAESAGVLTSTTDQDLLLDLVKYAPSTRIQTADDPLATARLRGAQMRETVLAAEGGTVSAEQAGRLLGISRQAVDRRRKLNQLIALPIGGRAYAYPCWQFSDADVLRGFPTVLRSFSTEGEWTRAAFFLSPSYSLNGERPLDVLRRGDVDAVVRAATRYGEQGAE